MKVVEVRCSGCAAPISVSERARFVTCRFCNAQLSVQHTDSSIFTEVVENMAADTQDSAKSLRIIQLQGELEILDREFEMERTNLQTSDKHGRKSDPSIAGGIFALVIGGCFVCLWIGFAVSMGAPIFFPLFGVVMLIALIGGAIGIISGAGKLNTTRAIYTRKRTALLRDIERERRAQAQPVRF